MQVFDLHCDTLYRAFTDKKTLNEPHYHISINRGLKYDKWAQVMAIWIPDELRGHKAFDFANSAIDYLHKQNIQQRKIQLFDSFHKEDDYHFCLAIEGGAALGGELKNVKHFRKRGVRFLTLTWNAENEIGDGAGVEASKGITAFGKKVIKEMELCGMIVDVSHASDVLFYDVAAMAGRPFVATHSNARAVCNHKRNLTDDQFLQIKNIGGLVGLNFCTHFLNENQPAGLKDILNHTEYFLSLGGENIVCLGSDFDGTDMPNGITGIESMALLYEYYLKHNYNEGLVKKIFYENANAFCQNFDK